MAPGLPFADSFSEKSITEFAGLRVCAGILKNVDDIEGKLLMPELLKRLRKQQLPGTLGLIVVFLLHGCGIPVSRVDGQLNVHHFTEYSFKTIDLLNKEVLEKESLVTLEMQQHVSEGENRGPIVASAGEWARIGAGTCLYEEPKQPYENSEPPSDHDLGDIVRGAVGDVVLCTLIILTGGLLGALKGAIVGPSESFQEEPFSVGWTLRESILKKKVTKKLWDQLVSITSGSKRTSNGVPRRVEFGGQLEFTDLVKIEPKEIGLYQIDEAKDLLTLKMTIHFLFCDKNEQPWAEDYLEARVGEYSYDRWRKGDNQLVKEAMHQGIQDIAQKIVTDLQETSQAPDASSSLAESPPFTVSPQ